MPIRYFFVLFASLLLMAQSSPDPKALYKAGYDARVEGDWPKAVRLLTMAIQTGRLNKDDLATSYNNRGMALSSLGDNAKAIADYTAAINIAPAYGPAYLNRGNLLSNAGKLDEALADYNTALKIAPEYVFALNSRGAVFYKKGDLEPALADLDAAIRLKPDYANAYWNRARVYMIKHEQAKALEDFGKAIEFKPNDPELRSDRGNVLSEQGNNAAAIADYNAAIKLAPNVPLGYVQRGNSYFFTGEIEKSVADYGTAIKLAPDFADPYTNRGRIELFHADKPAAAAEDLAQGTKLDPKDVYAPLWLHIARSRTGNDDQKELAANAERLGDHGWPHPVLALFLGKATPEAVRKAAGEADSDGKRKEQNCEADFYLGMFNLEKKLREDARKLIAIAADTCPADMLEKNAAKAELSRLQ